MLHLLIHTDLQLVFVDWHVGGENGLHPHNLPSPAHPTDLHIDTSIRHNIVLLVWRRMLAGLFHTVLKAA